MLSSIFRFIFVEIPKHVFRGLVTSLRFIFIKIPGSIRGWLVALMIPRSQSLEMEVVGGTIDVVLGPKAARAASQALSRLDHLVEHSRMVYEESERFKEQVYRDVAAIQQS
jgi:hypothetical protein